MLLRGNEGTRKSSAKKDGRRGIEGEGEGEERERRGKERKGPLGREGKEEEKSPKELKASNFRRPFPRRGRRDDAIDHVESIIICVSDSQSWVPVGHLSASHPSVLHLIAYPATVLSLHNYSLFPLPLSGEKNFMDKKKKTCDRSQSIHISPHSCAACTGNSNTTSFPVNRRYTEENESSLYSSDVESLASKNLYTIS